MALKGLSGKQMYQSARQAPNQGLSDAIARRFFLVGFRRLLRILLRRRTVFAQASLALFVLLLFLRNCLLAFFVLIVWCRQFELFSTVRSGSDRNPGRPQRTGRIPPEREETTLPVMSTPCRLLLHFGHGPRINALLGSHRALHRLTNGIHHDRRRREVSAPPRC